MSIKLSSLFEKSNFKKILKMDKYMSIPPIYENADDLKNFDGFEIEESKNYYLIVQKTKNIKLLIKIFYFKILF